VTAAAGLERIARDVVPPVGATGWRITVLDRTTYAVVPVIGGRLDGKPVFRGSQADCHRFDDILTGASLRPAPRSVAAVETRGRPAERGADRSLAPQDSLPRPGGRGARASRLVDGEARSSGRNATVTSPGPPCKACGADLSGLAPSRTGQRRQTCDDACRQAYRRGQRAPLPGVVDDESIGRLSRLSRRSTAAHRGAPTHRGRGGSQLVLPGGAPA